MNDAALRRNPFPGLRPFEPDEEHLFFGRDQQIDELLRRLGTQSFVAVSGESGSGKSSLIRAGLLPALYGGFIARAGSAWRIAVCRPGADPIGQLARALADPAVLGTAAVDADLQEALLETTLRRGGRGLVEAMRQARLGPSEQLLVVVDQFEEIFRFKRAALRPAAADEAAAFVKLLLEAVAKRELPIYVILTLRSDFLGDCAEFHGLPETINQGIFLIPRMSRDELRLACEGPVRVAGGDIAPRLLHTLLNEVGDDPDQLPLLQHALMRTWEHWQGAGSARGPLDLEHYQAVGGLQSALSRHADEAYFELGDERRPLAEKLFKCLCDRGPDNREVRRPAPLAEIGQVLGVAEAEVIAVVEGFRRADRSFLMPPPKFPLRPETVVDIGHESLIRQWIRLREWVSEDAESRDVYLRLADAAERHARGRAGLWHDPELQHALDWQQQRQPTPAWGSRLHPQFERTMAFLDASRANREEEARRARAARDAARRQGYLLASVILTAIFGSLLFYVFHTRQQLQTQFALLQVGKLTVDSRSIAEATPSLLERSALLAIEALRRVEEIPPESALREDLAIRSRSDLEYDLPLLTRPKLRMRHSGTVYAVAFSPDGDAMATGSVQGAAVWSSADGHLIAGWQGGAVHALAFRPGGDGLAVAGADGSAELLDVQSGNARRILRAAQGHTKPIRKFAFSPEGRYLAAGDEGGQVCVWDLTGSGAETCLQQGGSIRTVAFSPDGRHLAAGSSLNTAMLWRWQDNRASLRATLKHRDTIQSLAFSPDSHFLVTGSDDKNVAVWDVREDRDDQQLLHLLPHRGRVKEVAFSPDGRWLTTANTDGMLRMWSWPVTEPHNYRVFRHHDAVLGIAFSPDGQRLATVSEDDTGKLWDVVSGLELARLAHHSGPVRSVAFSPDGKSIVTGGFDGLAILWSPAERSGLRAFGHADTVGTLAYSPSGRLIVSGARDNHARLWEVASGRMLADFPHGGNVKAVAFNRDERLLATASSDGSARIWEVASGKELARLHHDGFVSSVAFSPDSRLLLSGGADDKARLWQTGDGKQVAEFDHPDTVNEIAFSPGGEFIATTSEDQTARVWDPQTGAVLFSVPFQGPARILAFSPDGKYFAAGGMDAAARLWSMETRREIARLPHKGPIKAIRFSPDSRWIATGSTDNTSSMWSAADGSLARSLSHEGSVMAIAFSSDGKLMATGSDANNARIWDAASDRELARYYHPGPVLALAFNPAADSQLAIASSENVLWLRTWNRPLAEVMADACNRLGRNLTPEEWKRYFGDEPFRPSCKDAATPENVFAATPSSPTTHAEGEPSPPAADSRRNYAAPSPSSRTWVTRES